MSILRRDNISVNSIARSGEEGAERGELAVVVDGGVPSFSQLRRGFCRDGGRRRVRRGVCECEDS